MTPGTVYALSFNSGSRGGVWRGTTNGGASWQRILNKPQSRAMAVNPGNAQQVAVLTQGWTATDICSGDGVWISTNGGTGWLKSNTGLRTFSGRTIAFNPDNSAEIGDWSGRRLLRNRFGRLHAIQWQGTRFPLTDSGGNPTTSN